MADIYIKEGRKEILIVLEKHMPDRLTALNAAAKVLQREVLREQSNPRRNADWKPDDHIVSPD